MYNVRDLKWFALNSFPTKCRLEFIAPTLRIIVRSSYTAC